MAGKISTGENSGFTLRRRRTIEKLYYAHLRGCAGQMFRSATCDQGQKTAKNGITDQSPEELERINVLASGLNFCPTSKNHPIQLCVHVGIFFRRMRITDFFSNEEDRTGLVANRDNQIHPSSAGNQDWTPKECKNLKLDMYIDCVRRRFESQCSTRDQTIRYMTATCRSQITEN